MRPVGGRIDLRRAPGSDRVLVDRHASGREYLIAGDGVKELRRHRVDSNQVIDRLPVAALAAPGPVAKQDRWSLCAGHLTDEVLLASVQSDDCCWRMLVRRRPMRLLGWVDYDLNVGAPGGFERPSGRHGRRPATPGANAGGWPRTPRAFGKVRECLLMASDEHWPVSQQVGTTASSSHGSVGACQ